MTTNWGRRRIWFSRAATLCYLKCPVFNIKLCDRQQNKKIWPIHRKGKQSVETEVIQTLGLLDKD